MATIREKQGAAHTRIMGVGGYAPSRVVTNEEVCTWIDSSDEWIRTRSGIAERRWATPEETVAGDVRRGLRQGAGRRRHRPGTRSAR